MCGLVGYMAKIGSPTFVQFFTQGLFSSEFRGRDATGFAWGDIKNKEFQLKGTLKKPYPAHDFLELAEVQTALSTSPDFILGHTRAASGKWVGGHWDVPSARDAHPFTFDHITLTHNGYVPNYHPTGAPTALIDSARIAYGMSIQDEKEVLQELTGDFALVWLNTKTNMLNMARNDGRPLWFAVGSKQPSVFWASEQYLLNWILDRNDITYQKDTLYYLEANTRLQFNLEKIGEYSLEKFEAKKKVYPIQYGYSPTYPPNTKKDRKALKIMGYRIGQKIKVRLLSRTWGTEDVCMYDVLDLNGKHHNHIAKEFGRPVEEAQAVLSKPFLERQEEAEILGIINGQYPALIIETIPEAEVLKLPGPEVPTADKTEFIGPHGLVIPETEWFRLTHNGCSLCGRILRPKDKLTWEEHDTGQHSVYCEECMKDVPGGYAETLI